MFRILLVEDQPNTLEELRELLLEVFPTSLIETADTVETGRQKIKDAVAQPFDVAILDFKLPARPGENPEIDESLCLAIKESMPDTLVIHITGFHEDPIVIQHRANYHSGKDAPRVEIIQKTAYWPEKLLGEMKTYLYGKYLHGQLVSLFVRKSLLAGPARTNSNPRGHLTHKIAALSREILAYWDFLDNSTKASIQEHFIVSELQGRLHVSLRLSL